MTLRHCIVYELLWLIEYVSFLWVIFKDSYIVIFKDYITHSNDAFKDSYIVIFKDYLTHSNDA